MAHANLALERLDPGDPQPRGFIVFLGLGSRFAVELFFLGERTLAVAVMCLIVDDDDILE